jgi:hypothetical protein
MTANAGIRSQIPSGGGTQRELVARSGMKISRFNVLWTAALALAVATTAALTAWAAPPDLNAALGAWLPSPNTGFDAWSKGQAAVTNQYDYFVCGSARAPSEEKRSFYYAGSACPLMNKGTSFAYGPAGPMKGAVLYDRAHRIVLYDKGCCAERGFALTANVAPPPKPVSDADLSGVHTMRGVSLGMSQAHVERIYGSTRPHDAKGRPGIATLSYTTMKTKPTEPGGDPCGQFQSFSFRQNRLISIELLAGC